MNGRRVAVLVVMAVVVVALLALPSLIVAEADRRDGPDDGSTSGRGTVTPVEQLAVGDCLPGGQDPSIVATRRVVPCSEPHAQEVFATPELDAGAFPGEDAVVAMADEVCRAGFERFVGLAFDASVIDLLYLSPVEESWETERGVVCLVADVEETTGTLQDAAR